MDIVDFDSCFKMNFGVSVCFTENSLNIVFFISYICFTWFILVKDAKYICKCLLRNNTLLLFFYDITVNAVVLNELSNWLCLWWHTIPPWWQDGVSFFVNLQIDRAARPDSRPPTLTHPFVHTLGARRSYNPPECLVTSHTQSSTDAHDNSRPHLYQTPTLHFVS